MRLAAWGAPPYKARTYLAWMNERGFVSPAATLYHRGLRMGKHVFIGDRAIVFEGRDGGEVVLGDGACLFGDCLLETGQGGSIRIGAGSRVHRGCQLIAYRSQIHIGRDVGLAQNCALYPYQHGIAPGKPISEQPLTSKGPIVIGDHAWLGVGVIVLDGVRIGEGAVVGAGSIVTEDVPDGAIALGAPARVVKRRGDAGEGPGGASETRDDEARVEAPS